MYFTVCNSSYCPKTLPIPTLTFNARYNETYNRMDIKMAGSKNATLEAIVNVQVSNSINVDLDLEHCAVLRYCCVTS